MLGVLDRGGLIQEISYIDWKVERGKKVVKIILVLVVWKEVVFLGLRE